MRFLRLPFKDPRTVARDIPGFSNILFPGLVPGLVTGLNRTQFELKNINKVPLSVTSKISMNPAMLYEIAYARAEIILRGNVPVEGEYVKKAIKRQSRYFDAIKPKIITSDEKILITLVSDNLVNGLSELSSNTPLIISPPISGLEWISSSYGDFSFKTTLVEVKCTGKNFGANDYRQILLYWLLNYTKCLRTDDFSWEVGILFNPRQNSTVIVNFDELHRLVSGGRNIIETIELLQSVVLSARSKHS